ncbi:succinate dehydrogenase/fumarate reductase iron-sulfur subunit [Nitritalea halalkaliphila LW7]|uniref:Succinate dehydrogenase/fumarate reductase iron-sulfur subunit n=1 Tax=Nitritalea halalkaliphila LW7 TaxID=1189621 RepID=I5BW55_9BACT|nr:succinate dehydrogenase/fumarate reductase iron-sulfur subunit [Nitritalea halalkaliphila]EIM73807.1 succinate dehydrogenase/fumarate reductase iron-sulfur subunit [Nitritalea halalkaliphila LW7]
MKLTLKIWRQPNPRAKGTFETYSLEDLNPAMSVPEMLDVLNEQLMAAGKTPIAFDSDCREGICGQCGFVINGDVHSPERGATTCQTHLRSFQSGDTLVLEPFRAKAFPIKKDLCVDRRALDRIIMKGGYISVQTGQAPEANSTRIPLEQAETAFEAAACIGCGACVATCKNASAALFTGAKISHLALLPQGEPEAAKRVQAMVAQMDVEGFGACSMTGACEVVCPQGVSIAHIVRMHAEFWKS